MQTLSLHRKSNKGCAGLALLKNDRGAASIVASLVIILILVLLLFGSKFGLPSDLFTLFNKLQGIQIKPDVWRPAVSKDAGFLVDMPGQPVIEAKDETVMGAQLSALVYSINAPKRYLFQATFADLREHVGGLAPRTLLEIVRDSVVGVEQGKLASDAPISLGGIPGREFTIAVGEEMVRCRYYLIDQYLYSFRLRTTKEFVISKDADRFFASIKLTGPAASGPPLAPGWMEFSSTDGRFIVHMPGLPSSRQQNFTTKSGEMVLYIFTLDLGKGNEQFTVQYTDYPEQFLKDAQSAEAVLKKASTVDAFNIGGSVVSDKSLSLGRYPGREIQADNAELAMRIRLYLVNQRLYKVAATWPKSRTFSADDERFLASFRLIQ